MNGEISGYAHYLQTAYCIPKRVQFLLYDIICMYWPWLKKHDKQSVENMKQLCPLCMLKYIHGLFRYSVPQMVLNFILAVNIKTQLLKAQLSVESFYPHNNE